MKIILSIGRITVRVLWVIVGVWFGMIAMLEISQTQWGKKYFPRSDNYNINTIVIPANIANPHRSSLDTFERQDTAKLQLRRLPYGVYSDPTI